MALLHHLGDALSLAGVMAWQVLWPLVLGFLLSAVVETVVPKQAVSRRLGEGSARSAALATGFGAASSSCSYAAVALARALFRRGASLRNALIFELASTNLVFELGLVLLVLLGWRFLAAELAGGVVMIVIIVLLGRVALRPALVRRARIQAERGVAGRMEGHAAMDMSLHDGPLLRRLFSSRAYTPISHHFFMSVYSIWTDLVLGFLIAGALAAWVPDHVWAALFLSGHGVLTQVWDACVGPLIAMLSFVCSVGNIPLAAVLWRAGSSFGGVISFVFGDLLILPIVDIHRRYYGGRAALVLFAMSLLAMALAGLIVGTVFQVVGAAPSSHGVAALTVGISWDVDTYLDIAALLLVALLGVRFLRSGGVAMLRHMG